MFRNPISETVFYQKYAQGQDDTWAKLSHRLVHEVCDGLMNKAEIDALVKYHTELKVVFGGRYLYYAGRENKYYNNCYLLRAEEDSREDWANLSWKAESALMTGGGIGVDYSIYRPAGSLIRRTGGSASGPIPKMKMINEIGRNVMQGGSRRSAIYASLDRTHGDVHEFLTVKDWQNQMVGNSGLSLKDLKAHDFNFPAPLDMTNVSVNYKTDWLRGPRKDAVGDATDEVFLKNVRQAAMTGEPGFSFNFFEKENETLRNACTEVCSEDDSDVCNLGSINMGRVETLEEFIEIIELSTKFLVCGTLKAVLPYEKVYETREKNRRLGLGLMGVHEWLLKRGYRYEMTEELRSWMYHYRHLSQDHAELFSAKLDISTPIAQRAIAPTGSIGMIAGTTTGIEPIFAVAFKRRYLKAGDQWHWQHVVDGSAQELIDVYGLDPEKIESALDLAADPERRIKFQADMQDYVDQSISSTLNIPAWGSELNNESTLPELARIISRYAPRLRGLTMYPDGSRGGQPLSPVPYAVAKEDLGNEYRESTEWTDICDLTGGGTCGS